MQALPGPHGRAGLPAGGPGHHGCFGLAGRPCGRPSWFESSAVGPPLRLWWRQQQSVRLVFRGTPERTTSAQPSTVTVLHAARPRYSRGWSEKAVTGKSRGPTARADDRSNPRSRTTSAGSGSLGLKREGGRLRERCQHSYIGGGCLSSRSSTVGGEACMYVCRQHSAGTVVSRSEESPWLPVLLSFFSCPACRQRRHFGVADATGVPRSRHSMVHA